METVRTRILGYPDLSSAEQQMLEEEVAADHPEQAALLDDVKALERVLEAARAPGVAEPPAEDEDAALARLLVAPAAQRERPPFEALAAALREAEAGSPLRERAAALAARLRAIEEASTGAAAQFEALTRHSLDALPKPGEQGSTRASGRRGGPTALRDASESREDHQSRSWGRYAAIALVVAALYGALFFVSSLSQSKAERLAAVGEERLTIDGYEGQRALAESAPADDSSAAALDARYLRGLRRLRGARTTTLGLFPRYDTVALGRAARDFDFVARQAEAESFVQRQAFFFLGKVHLARNEPDDATRMLRRVVVGGGQLAPEAQAILGQLHEEAAYDGPSGEA